MLERSEKLCEGEITSLLMSDSFLPAYFMCVGGVCQRACCSFAMLLQITEAKFQKYFKVIRNNFKRQKVIFFFRQTMREIFISYVNSANFISFMFMAWLLMVITLQ